MTKRIVFITFLVMLISTMFHNEECYSVHRKEYFGIAGGTNGKNATALLNELGVGSIRIPVNWGQVEPQPGVYNWDKVMNGIKTQVSSRPGMEVVITLRAKSPWAGKIAARDISKKATIPPRDLKKYYDFVYGMVKRGKGVVGYWQIENEMESRSWWSGTAGEYIELLRTAHNAARAADPSAKVMLGGFTSEMTTAAVFQAMGASKEETARRLGIDSERARLGGGEAIRESIDFMNLVLAGAKDYFDIADIHLYNEYETIAIRVKWLRDRMLANGYEKPIWATEVGGPDIRNRPYSESSQEEEVKKRIPLAFSSGIERVFWLGLYEMQNQGERFNHLGLVTLDGRKKPAFYAYKSVIKGEGDRPARAGRLWIWPRPFKKGVSIKHKIPF